MSDVSRWAALRALSPRFEAGLRRVREVTDTDGILPASHKALFMAGALAARRETDGMTRELRRACALGLPLAYAYGAGLALLISRGEGAFERFHEAIAAVYGMHQPPSVDSGPVEATPELAEKYFQETFGTLPDYVALLRGMPRALEGYYLMRQSAVLENPMPPKLVDLFYVTVNAAEFMAWNVGLHARSARKFGASEAELVEAALCAFPVAGAPAWIAAADGLGRQA